MPEVKAGRWYFEQLWVNGERATRARSPNQFYYYMVRKVDRGIDPLTGKEADLGSRAIVGRPEDLEPVFRVPKRPAERRDRGGLSFVGNLPAPRGGRG